MIALSVSDITLSFGTETVLKNISFAVNDGDKVGVIGVNGAGKTSLFRVINGDYKPDAGAVYLQRGYEIGCLEQNPDLTALPRDTTPLEYMYSAFPALLSMERKITLLESEISHLSDAGMHDAAVQKTEELTELNRKYTEGGGLEFRSRSRSMLMRLGFEEELIERKISTLSGGQYTRLALARLLAAEPDVLMLDEPTNHLDIDALAWLEGYIASYKKTVIIISHDRYFLDRTTNKTLHIQYAGAKLYNGNYTATKDMQEAERASLEKRYKEQQKEIAKIKANIEFQRRCNREHNFVTIRSKEKQLARMEKVELAPPDPKNIRIKFNSEEESAGDVLLARDLSFSYSGTPLIKNISFLIRRYERVLFLGKNGSGKSTLMKLINSMLTPTAGSITLGYNIKIGYYDQENRGLSLNKTVFEEMHDEYPEKKDGELRSALALFLFDADDIDKPISVLSGGERARLTLAKLMLKKVNLLVMDEPTNHLDIGSAEALENALLAFDGTIIAVSHDRYFINRIATRIIEIDDGSERGLYDYSLEDYDDAYTEYMRIRETLKAARASSAELSAASEAKRSSKEDYEKRKRENADKRAEERKINEAKRKVAEYEKELEALEEELFGDAAANYVRAAEIEARKAEIEEELLELYGLIM